MKLSRTSLIITAREIKNLVNNNSYIIYLDDYSLNGYLRINQRLMRFTGLEFNYLFIKLIKYICFDILGYKVDSLNIKAYVNRQINYILLKLVREYNLYKVLYYLNEDTI